MAKIQDTPRRRLPTGVQSFRKIIEGNGYYVDKTPFVQLLLSELSSQFFLARPRRFGKSLLVSMMRELFLGNETLFRGLSIHDDWDWSSKHPVISLDLGNCEFRKPGQLENSLNLRLASQARIAGVPEGTGSAVDHLNHVIDALREINSKGVVILIDEYDVPILDVMAQKDIARDNRETLRRFFAVLKARHDDIHFAFLTGVTKFSKLSLFSGANHLEDISIDPRYSSICGYADRDIDETFGPELEGLDRDLVRE